MFAGHTFIPDSGNFTDDDMGFEIGWVKNHTNPLFRDWDGKLVINGMVQGLDGADIYRHFETKTPSRHLSVVFNLFVLMQIWNMLAARKINDEINIFQGVFTNLMFIGVWLVIVGGQFFIVQFGGWALKVHLNGLTGPQWIICLAVSVICLFWNFVLKFVPDHICPTLGDEKEGDVLAAKLEYQNLRKNRDLSSSVRQGNYIKNKEGNSFKK